MQPTGGGRRRAKAFYGLMAQSKGRAFSSKFVERAKGLLGQGKGSYGLMSAGLGRGPTTASGTVVPAFCDQACGYPAPLCAQPCVHAPCGMVLTKSSNTHKRTPLQIGLHVGEDPLATPATTGRVVPLHVFVQSNRQRPSRFERGVVRRPVGGLVATFESLGFTHARNLSARNCGFLLQIPPNAQRSGQGAVATSLSAVAT